VSEPTYLIRVEHAPTDPMLPYSAIVSRLSDQSHVVTRWGTSAEEAVKAAQEYLRALAGQREPDRTLYADEDGTIAVGESVRVLRQP
jgi:hypothetical protein